MTLEEIRQQYPQYQNVTDETLALSLHKKYYSDVPFEEFARKIGYLGNPQSDIDRTTGLTNLPLRLKLSFIEDSEQKLKYLRSIYPSAHYGDGGELLYENPETGKMTVVDEQGRSLRDVADWIGMMPEVAGTTVGVATTAWMPVPGARFAGAGVGYSAGREFKDWAAEIITDTKRQRKPPKQYLQQKGKEIALGAGAELVGAGLVKAAGPFAKRITPEMKRAMDYFKAYGGRMTPAQATETRVLDLLENVAESSLLGGGKVRTFKLQQKELVENIADDIVRSFGKNGTAEEIGIAVQQAIEGRKVAFNKAARAMYRKVDELTGGVEVSTAPLKKEAAKLLRKISPGGLTPSLQNKTTVRMLQDFADLPESVPFSYLQQWRSDLLQVGYGPNDLIPGKTQGMAKHLAKKIDRMFRQAEGGLSDEALLAFREANSFWRVGKETFNHKFIKSLAQSQPEKIVDSIFKPGVTGNIRRIKGLVGHETAERLERAFAQKLLFRESVSGMGSGFPEGALSGRRLHAALRKYGDSTLKEAFGEAKLIEIKKFADVLAMTQQRTPYLGGGLFIQLQQAGAIMEMAGIYGMGAGFTKVGAAILLGPRALSELFTRPSTIRYLTKGLVTKPGSKEAVRLSGRILGAISMHPEDVKIVPDPRKEELRDIVVP